MIQTQPLSREQYLDLYYYMQLDRQLEERMTRLFRQNKIVGGLYSSLGQEAVSVGTAYALEKRDWLWPAILKRRGVFEFGAGSGLRGHGVRAGKARVACADDSQHRGVSCEGRAPEGYFYAAYGEVNVANEGEGRHESLRRFEGAAHRFADFDAGGFDSRDDGRGNGGALSGAEYCGDDVDWGRRQLDGGVFRRAGTGGFAARAVCADHRE